MRVLFRGGTAGWRGASSDRGTKLEPGATGKFSGTNSTGWDYIIIVVIICYNML